jgi:hypothetical protein
VQSRAVLYRAGPCHANEGRDRLAGGGHSDVQGHIASDIDLGGLYGQEQRGKFARLGLRRLGSSSARRLI